MDGETVTATDEHPFFVRQGEGGGGEWVDAGALEAGDLLLTPEGETAEVEGVESHWEGERVYNLTVEGLHTFFVRAGGGEFVLTHNSCPYTPYVPSRPLPRDTNGNPVPDSPYPHTQLGEKTSKRSGGTYPQAREFGQDGKQIRDVDFTDHGRPQNHTSPHQHPIDPVTGKRGYAPGF